MILFRSRRVLPVRATLALLPLLLGLGISQTAFAQKTDVVHLHNGDYVTGEIKELARGQLRFSTNALGTIYVKWEDVEGIESNKWLQVEIINGRQFFGPVQASGLRNELAMEVSGDIVNLDLKRIVSIQPIKSTGGFRGNLDNSLSVGFTYTSASDVMQWNVNASTKYRTQKYLVSASYDSLVTNNGTGTDSVSRDLTANYYRLRSNRWFLFGSGSYQENDELGIKGRILTSVGAGRFVSTSTSHELLLAAGLTGNFEKSRGTDIFDGDSETSAEGLLVADWTYFRLHTPKSDVNVSFNFYPGITDTDRQRGDFRIRYRQEFFEDLFLNVTYFDRFDTKPPAGATSKRDYGLITGLEYEF